MTVICLLRHGETDWNKQQRIQGRSDIPLNRAGVQQATEARDLIWTSSWDEIYSSPLDRAKQTAHILKGEETYDVHVVDAFTEKSFGGAEGGTYDYVFSTFPGGVYPGAETDEAVVKRTLEQFAEIHNKHEGKKVLVVTHGAVIHALLAYFDAIPEGLEHIRLHHLHQNTFTYEAGEWTVTDVNRSFSE